MTSLCFNTCTGRSFVKKFKLKSVLHVSKHAVLFQVELHTKGVPQKKRLRNAVLKWVPDRKEADMHCLMVQTIGQYILPLYGYHTAKRLSLYNMFTNVNEDNGRDIAAAINSKVQKPLIAESTGTMRRGALTSLLLLPLMDGSVQQLVRKGKITDNDYDKLVELAETVFVQHMEDLNLHYGKVTPANVLYKGKDKRQFYLADFSQSKKVKRRKKDGKDVQQLLDAVEK